MSERIDDVLVLGGGDVGLITALCVDKLNPDIDVRIVDDFDQPVPKVGKSTYLKIMDVLHGTLDIDEQAFVEEVKPVWKLSLYFRDWCGYDSFHYPFDQSTKYPTEGSPNAAEKYYHYYDEVVDNDDYWTKGEQIVHQRKSPWFFSPQAGANDRYQYAAYQVSIERFNDYLRELCRERGVSLVNDQITDVGTDGNRITGLHSKSQTYESDLYIDATGFARIIKGEQETEYREFDIPLDSAYGISHDRDLSDVIPATVVDTGDHGWFWTIDTFEARHRGYVYASEYVSDEDALAEFVEEVNADVSAEDAVQYTFDSGYYPQSWQENLVTIGNAEGFIEPLQATNLTANAHAGERLAEMLSTHGRFNEAGVRDAYNAWVQRTWESIYDFIATHYRYADGDTPFWQDVQEIPVTDRVEYLEEQFDERGFAGGIEPARTDPEIDEFNVFYPKNFYLLMTNMGATSEFYETHDFEVSDDIEREERQYYQKMHDDVETHLTTEEMYEMALGAPRRP